MNEFNEKTYLVCEKVLDRLDEDKINYIIFGGFAVYLNILDYFNSKGEETNKDAVRDTEDIDIIGEDIIEMMDSVKDIFNLYSKEQIDMGILIKELEMYGECSGKDILLEDNRKIDLLEKIQGRTYNSMEYKIINYQGKPYNVATPEELLSMKLEMVKLYGLEGVRKKDLMDIGVLEHLIEAQKPKKKKRFLLWD